MPIYEYICSACDHRADILHGLHDPGPLFCPSCGSEGTMRKAIATPTIIYKGSGWAKKDRRATSSPRSGSADQHGGGSDKKSESSSGESSSGDSSSGGSSAGDSPSGRASTSGDSGGDSAKGEAASGDSKTHAGTTTRTPTGGGE